MMEINDIVKITKGNLLSGDPLREIEPSKISTDSRTIKRGEFFIALSGPNFDGNGFVSDAFGRGAAGAIVQDSRFKIQGSRKKVIIKVEDTTRALQEIAHAHRMRFDIPVIAVTGSNGKTTVKEMIWAVLSAKRNVLKSEGTKNNHIGVPQTLLKLKGSHDACVLELGANHKGEIWRLAKITRPTIVVITNIGPSHLEFLTDLEGVYREKRSALRFLDKRKGAAVINGDDAFLGKIRDGAFKIIRFGFKAPNDLRAEGVSIKNGRLTFMLDSKGSFELGLLGLHNICNALAAIAVARQLGIDYPTIARSLADFKGASMRLDIKRMNGINIIDDSYNSNPLSMEAAIRAMMRYPARAKWIVSADMLELGGSSDHFHRMIGRSIAESGIDGLITFGSLSRHTLSGAMESGMMKDRLWHCSSRGQIAAILKRVARKGDAILIKGSRDMRMEEVLDKLRG